MSGIEGAERQDYDECQAGVERLGFAEWGDRMLRAPPRFPPSHDLPLAVRGGGHNRLGFGVCDRG